MALHSSRSPAPGHASADPAAQAFDIHIAPQISALHARRVELREQTKREGIIIGVASVVCALLLAFVQSDGDSLWVLGLIAGAIGIAWRLNSHQKAWNSHVIDTVMPVLCEALGDVEHHPTGIDPAVILPFEQLGLIPTSTRQGLSHLLRGRHRATGFEVLYADLSERRRSGENSNASSSNVFHGLLFRIQVPAHIPIHIAIKPRFFGVPAVLTRLFQPAVVAKLTEVQFADSEFASKFEVRAELREAADAERVRALISPEIQRAFLALNEREGALLGDRAAFSAAFAEDSFYLALSRYGKTVLAGIAFEKTRPFLDPGLYVMGDEVELETRLRLLLSDAQIAHRIIDQLRQAN